jgi:RimJ/RimL family protein N-acetyltransferase
MLNHAFKYVDTVVFYVDPKNTRSQRSVENIGGIKDDDLDARGRVVYRVEKTSYNDKGVGDK